MKTRPGEMQITLTFKGQEAADLMRLHQASARPRRGDRKSLPKFVKGIVLEVIADDLASHQERAA